MSELTGKVAIVTGAGRGLGRVEAIQLARQGARVVINEIGLPAAREALLDRAFGRLRHRKTSERLREGRLERFRGAVQDRHRHLR